MAIDHRYVDVNAPGGGDGTTDGLVGANAAWTITEAFTNATGDMCVWIKWNAVEYAVILKTVAGTGVIANNTWLRFIGYYDLAECTRGQNPSLIRSDMDYEQAQYQSPLDAYVNGIM